MNLRQKVSKALYPLIMKLTKGTSKGAILKNDNKKAPAVPFYDLKAYQNNGLALDFSQFKNKKVLLVNTASNCGYTNQYSELQKLYEQKKTNLVIIGFPANDFNEQEKLDDSGIAEFCQVNFGVTFPLVKKSVVVKNKEQNPVYKWLSEKNKNGWNERQPDWNFSKYLVNEYGILTHYFGSAVSPLSPEITEAINSK
jgi:glutathione peroxidase